MLHCNTKILFSAFLFTSWFYGLCFAQGSIVKNEWTKRELVPVITACSLRLNYSLKYILNVCVSPTSKNKMFRGKKWKSGIKSGFELFRFCWTFSYWRFWFLFIWLAISNRIVCKIGKPIGFVRKKWNVLYLQHWYSEPKTNKKLGLSFVFVNRGQKNNRSGDKLELPF